jgi:cob(I)alamin adenosyltransferase
MSKPPREAPIQPMHRRARSLVLVNTGEGKGKSTAAFGVVLRARAREWPVLVCQFVKSDRWKVGEQRIAPSLGVDWVTGGDGFTWLSDDLEASKARARACWQQAAEALQGDRYRLIVLDELTYPINWGWLDGDEVVQTIVGRSEQTNVIITGRDAPDALLAIADTATEMVKLRHAYDSGVRARRGIDF